MTAGPQAYRAAGNVEYVAELKMDGLAVELVYEHGVLTGAGTRGDGFTGEDVSTDVKTIRSYRWGFSAGRAMSSPGKLAVRGEVFIEKRDFEALNEERGKRGEASFRQSTKRSRGVSSPARPIHYGRPAPSRLLLRNRRLCSRRSSPRSSIC